MKIDSYDLYHIGFKLSKYVNLFTLKNSLIDILSKKGYKIPKKNELTLPSEIIGNKDDIKIELNYGSSALNIIGKNPKQIMKYSIELLELLNDLDYNEGKNSFSFFEIIINILVKIENIPEQVFTDATSMKISCPVNGLDDFKCISIRYASGIMEKQNEFFDIMIEISSERPKECIFIRGVYRTKNWNNIINFNSNNDQYIFDIIKSIGGK